MALFYFIIFLDEVGCAACFSRGASIIFGSTKQDHDLILFF